MTYDQFTVLIEQCRLLMKLQTTLAGHPEGGWKVRTDLVLDNGVPDVLCKPTNNLHVFVVFQVTGRTCPLR